MDLVKLSDPPDSESSLTHLPESFWDSTLDPWEKTSLTTLGDFLNRPYSHTSSISSEESPPESFRDLQKATQQLTLRDKMVEDKAEVCEISDSLLGSAPSPPLSLRVSHDADHQQLRRPTTREGPPAQTP